MEIVRKCGIDNSALAGIGLIFGVLWLVLLAANLLWFQTHDTVSRKDLGDGLSVLGFFGTAAIWLLGCGLFAVRDKQYRYGNDLVIRIKEGFTSQEVIDYGLQKLALRFKAASDERIHGEEFEEREQSSQERAANVIRCKDAFWAAHGTAVALGFKVEKKWTDYLKEPLHQAA